MPPKIDEDACTGCGTCVENCPSEVLVIEDDKAKIVNADDCVECGACEENCPSDAIKLE
ncbi:MAG TPA: 4Fe-4S binding protein [Candidatus Deferrimicrobium sp.]|nr:4Fe-4S binding protein [Candidatus Deferrimicrobium sp.]